MDARPRKLGVMISAPPGAPGFSHGIGLARAALAKRDLVYLYCIDEAVAGLPDPRLAELQQGGAKLFACAYSLQKRGLAAHPGAVLAGMSMLSDIMASTDRFVSFNQ